MAKGRNDVTLCPTCRHRHYAPVPKLIKAHFISMRCMRLKIRLGSNKDAGDVPMKTKCAEYLDEKKPA